MLCINEYEKKTLLIDTDHSNSPAAILHLYTHFIDYLEYIYDFIIIMIQSFFLYTPKTKPHITYT